MIRSLNNFRSLCYDEYLIGATCLPHLFTSFFLWELSLCYLTIYPQINGSNRQPFFVVVPNSASQRLGLSSAERFVWSMLDLQRSLIRREACWGWRAWDGFTVMYGGWQAVGQVLDVVAPSTLR